MPRHHAPPDQPSPPRCPPPHPSGWVHQQHAPKPHQQRQPKHRPAQCGYSVARNTLALPQRACDCSASTTNLLPAGVCVPRMHQHRLPLHHDRYLTRREKRVRIIKLRSWPRPSNQHLPARRNHLCDRQRVYIQQLLPPPHPATRRSTPSRQSQSLSIISCQANSRARCPPFSEYCTRRRFRASDQTDAPQRTRPPLQPAPNHRGNTPGMSESSERTRGYAGSVLTFSPSFRAPVSKPL